MCSVGRWQCLRVGASSSLTQPSCFFLLSSLTLCIVRFNRSAHRFRTRVFVNSGECGLGEGGGDERERERTMGYRLRNASEMTSAVDSRPLFDTETLSKPERVCEWPP